MEFSWEGNCSITKKIKDLEIGAMFLKAINGVTFIYIKIQDIVSWSGKHWNSVCIGTIGKETTYKATGDVFSFSPDGMVVPVVTGKVSFTYQTKA